MDDFQIAINEMATGKLPQGDLRWATFNDSFSNRTIDVVGLANEIYTGHAYTTWHTGRRKSDSFLSGQHIAVDLDTGDERSDPATLMRDDLIQTYATLIHTTPSHTPQSPRCRVIFVLDGVMTDPAAYTAAVTFTMALFAGSADASCKDPCRFFYGAKDCHIELPLKILPIAHLRTFYARHKHQIDKTTQAHTAPQREAPTPIENVSTELERIADALQHVDPYGIDYNSWIGLIAAMRQDLGNEALPLVRRWAQGKDGEIDREWERLGKRDGNGASIASVYWLARQNGWRGSAH